MFNQTYELESEDVDKIPRFFYSQPIPYILVIESGTKPAIPPTYRKWPQLLIDTKNCIYQKLENVVISAETVEKGSVSGYIF